MLRGFLPAASPRIEDYEFFEFYEPANQLGGDYYDYIPLPGGRLAVVVADVSGKGIPASLLMARLSADARYCLASEPTPAEAVGRLNRAFCEAGWEDRFVTLVLAVLDPRAARSHPGQRRPPAAAVAPRPGQDRGRRRGRNPFAPGRRYDTSTPSTRCRLQPGNMLALYTDGITEAMNDDDQLYGAGPAAAAVGLLRSTRVDRIGRRILEDVKRFVGLRPQSDDMCLVCFGRKAESGAGEEKR